MKAIVAMVLAGTLGTATADHLEGLNLSGGKIVLTGLDCPSDKGLAYMYVTHPNGNVIEGCWAVIAEQFHVIFSDGSRRVYNPQGFRYVKTSKRGGPST